MNVMKYVPKGVTRAAGRAVLSTKANSPTLLFGAGVVAMVGTVVLASRATLKVDEVLDDVQTDIDNIHSVLESGHPDYDEQDARKDKVVAYSKAAGRIVKLYGPAIILGATAIGCLAGGQIILNRRNVALTAAYAAVDQAFKEYRARVVTELGEDKDREFRYGYEDVEIIKETKKGHKVETVRRVAPGTPSMYARFFDECSPLWEPNAELNLIAIKCQQNWANDKLQARGHLFLNEVYDSLGIPRTKAGAVVGWVISPEGDNYVDFGVFDRTDERVRDFVNGRERSILLDFNVDGPILDKFEMSR